jgi:hypothetical protein
MMCCSQSVAGGSMSPRRVVFLVLVAALFAPPSGVAHAAANWRTDRIWDDGNAEFCAYTVTWSRYGNLYPGRALLVLVKEPWNPELDVKADTPRADGFEVLKLNHIRDVPTGIYTYHQMASLFWRRDTGALRKIAATSSEACGISTADMTHGTLHTRSYFDGQGDARQPWPADAVPEDGLPVVLRDWVTARPPATLRVVPSLLAGRFGALEPRAFTLQRTDAGTVEVPAGRFRAVLFRLEHEKDWTSYTIETAAPHRLLRLQRSDGTEYRLVKAERIQYWRMHDPGGETWLPPDVR